MSGGERQQRGILWRVDAGQVGCLLTRRTRGRLEELRQHEENRRREAMRSRQIAERLGVEEAHMLEFQQFNALWDKRMAEFEQKSADLEEAMKERHGTELMEYRPSHPQPESLQEDRSLHPKPETWIKEGATHHGVHGLSCLTPATRVPTP